MPEITIKSIPFQGHGISLDEAAKEERKLKHENDALDEALKESFPASDPVAISVTHIIVTKK